MSSAPCFSMTHAMVTPFCDTKWNRYCKPTGSLKHFWREHQGKRAGSLPGVI